MNVAMQCCYGGKSSACMSFLALLCSWGQGGESCELQLRNDVCESRVGGKATFKATVAVGVCTVRPKLPRPTQRVSGDDGNAIPVEQEQSCRVWCGVRHLPGPRSRVSSRSRDRASDPQRRHCIVSQALFHLPDDAPHHRAEKRVIVAKVEPTSCLNMWGTCSPRTCAPLMSLHKNMVAVTMCVWLCMCFGMISAVNE